MKFISTISILIFLQNFGYSQELFNYEFQKNNSNSVCSNPQTLQDSIFCAWYRSDTLELFVKKIYDECPDSLKLKFKMSFGADNFDSLIIKTKEICFKAVERHSELSMDYKTLYYYGYLCFRYDFLWSDISKFLFENGIYKKSTD